MSSAPGLHKEKRENSHTIKVYSTADKEKRGWRYHPTRGRRPREPPLADCWNNYRYWHYCPGSRITVSMTFVLR